MADMEDHAKILEFCLTVIGLLTNGYSLFYICKHFCLKIHVFALIFVDAFVATTGCLISTVLDIFLLAGALQSELIR